MGYISLLYDTDQEIVNEYCESKSDRAANALIRKYSSFVYFTAFRYVENQHDAQDISQDVFVKVLSKLHTFKKQSSLQTWIYSITANQSKNFLRKKSLRKFLRIDKEISFDIEDKYQNTAQDNLECLEQNELLLKELANLPEKQREVFSLRYFEDLTYNEISKLLGTSVGGLKANYFHAVKKLSSKLGELK
ncbi:MAG: sigma-70 family RNA polymerase sigma factor [Candidatus Kapaibacterium sp.]